MAGAHYGMLDESIGADFVFAKEVKEAENPEEISANRMKEYDEISSNPYHSAARGFVDDVVMPQDTRKMIDRALDALENKWQTAFKAQPCRKYLNINL